MHIRVNGPIMGSHNNQIFAALDFWHRAGYSSSEAVFGKKPDPVVDSKMEQYLEYDEERDNGNENDEKANNTDYKRRITRQKIRQKKLKYVHGDIFDVLRDAERAADANDGNQQSGLSQDVENFEIDQEFVNHGVRESIMENVNDTMSEMAAREIYHSR